MKRRFEMHIDDELQGTIETDCTEWEVRDCYSAYVKSDEYDYDLGLDGFEMYAATQGLNISRVYVEQIFMET